MTAAAYDLPFEHDEAAELPRIETRSYRGGSLEELLPRIAEELGPDAVIIRRREGIVGGFAGFFGKRCVEVQAQATLAGVQEPAFEAHLSSSFVDAYDTEDDDAELRRLILASSEPLTAAEPEPPAAPGVVSVPAPVPAHMLASFAAALETALTVEEPKAFGPAAPDEAVEEASVDAAVEAEPVAVEPEPEPVAPEPVAVEAEVEVEVVPEPLAPVPDPVAVAPGPEPLAEAETDLSFLVQPLPESTRHPEPVRVPWLPRDSRGRSVSDARAWAALELERLRERSTSEPPRPPLALVQPPTPGLGAADVLRNAGIAAPIAAELERDVERDFQPFDRAAPLRAQARGALARRLEIRSGWRTRRRTVAVVGEAGVGRTLAVAALARAYASAGRSVAVVSLEPLRSALPLVQLLGDTDIAVQAAESPEEAAIVRRRIRHAELVVVDTPPLDRTDAASIRHVAALLAAVKADEVHLATRTGTEAESLRDLFAAAGDSLAIGRVLVTRADERRSLGGVATVAIETRTPFSYVARGAGAGGGIAPADASELAALVLP